MERRVIVVKTPSVIDEKTCMSQGMIVKTGKKTPISLCKHCLSKKRPYLINIDLLVLLFGAVHCT